MCDACTAYDTTPMETLASYVQAGGAVLDQHHPGWRTKIDTDRLDIGSGMDCVLGQLYSHLDMGFYTQGVVTLYRVTHPDVAADTDLWRGDHADLLLNWSVEHGFRWPVYRPELTETLTQLWCEEVTREQIPV